MTKPPSLGDSTTAYKRVLESYPLQGTRKDIVAQISSVLDAGGVQKIVVEIGRPLKVERVVKADVEEAAPEEGPPPETDDSMSLLRNGDMKDFPQPARTGPYAYLFQAFHILSQKRLKPKVLMVHTVAELQKWLRLEGFVDITEVYGIEVATHPEVPEMTALLVADSEPMEPPFSVRLTMEIHEANSREGIKERDSGQRTGRAPGKVGKPA